MQFTRFYFTGLSNVFCVLTLTLTLFGCKQNEPEAEILPVVLGPDGHTLTAVETAMLGKWNRDSSRTELWDGEAVGPPFFSETEDFRSQSIYLTFQSDSVTGNLAQQFPGRMRVLMNHLSSSTAVDFAWEVVPNKNVFFLNQYAYKIVALDAKKLVYLFDGLENGKARRIYFYFSR